MVFPHRQALRAWLLPFRYIDGIVQKAEARPRLGGVRNKVAPGLNPAALASLARYEGKPGRFSLIARRFARGCSHSGISMGLFKRLKPGLVWVGSGTKLRLG